MLGTRPLRRAKSPDARAEAASLSPRPTRQHARAAYAHAPKDRSADKEGPRPLSPLAAYQHATAPKSITKGLTSFYFFFLL